MNQDTRTVLFCFGIFLLVGTIAVLATHVIERGFENERLKEHIEQMYQRDVLDGDWKKR